MLENFMSIVFTLILLVSAGADLFEAPQSESIDETDIKSEYVTYTDYLAVTAEYPHDTNSFTQGLFFFNGEMYETTGRYGESKILKNIDIESGTAEKTHIFPDDIFAEGSVAFKDKLYVLSYRENKVEVFDPDTLEQYCTYSYPYQGWGLTCDENYLIAGDGTDKLYFWDENMRLVKILEVTRDGEAISNINELEYINGEIWANIWLSDEIIIIDKNSGKVKKTIDFSGLYTPEDDDIDNVLNGIAYDKENGKIYVTGKCWGKMFEFEIK